MFTLLRYGLRVWATISFDGEGGKKEVLFVLRCYVIC